MKKLLLVFMTLITMVRVSVAQATVKDFRDFSWGSTFNFVKNNEKAKLISQDKEDLISYTDDLGGSSVEVNYQFNDDGKLVSGSYIFTKIHSNPQLYIEDYSVFKKLLTTKYGNPELNKEEWSSNTTPSDKENYGQAVLDKNLTLYSVWTTTRSLIKIILTTSDNRPYLQIHYTANSLDELENKEEFLKALKKL